MTPPTGPNRRVKGEQAAWMFESWPQDSLYHAGQMLNLALLRLLVVAFYKPIAKPLLNWMTRK